MKKKLEFTLSLLLILITSGCFFDSKTIKIKPPEKPQSPISENQATQPNFDKDNNTNIEQIGNLYVALPVLNVRKTPVINAEMVTQALHGEPVKILSKSNSWVEVSLPEQFDYRGWVELSGLTSIASTNTKTGTKTSDFQKPKIITVASAIVYKLPDKNSETLGWLPMGNVVSSIVSEQYQDFTTVQLVNGQKGYILSKDMLDYIKSNPAQVSSDRILETANKLTGIPYLWGGMTTSGADCSGFVHTVFKVNGIKLHRDADLQYYHDGVAVNPKQLKPGDLVFFHSYKSTPSHEGIYVGNRKFIHSSSAGRGVKYSSLDEPYFVKHFIGAKRILQ